MAPGKLALVLKTHGALYFLVLRQLGYCQKTYFSGETKDLSDPFVVFGHNPKGEKMMTCQMMEEVINSPLGQRGHVRSQAGGDGTSFSCPAEVSRIRPISGGVVLRDVFVDLVWKPDVYLMFMLRQTMSNLV